MKNDIKLFGGTSNPALTLEVCQYLGVSPGKILAKTFSDGETRVELGENIRGRDVFVVQSTSTPVNDNLMQLLIIMDAMRRASAERITAVIPYYGYGRQDRKVKPRVPISAKLVADLIAPILLKYFQDNTQGDLVIVSPDAGGVERARAFAKRLSASLAIIDKRRVTPNVAEAMNIIGEVKGKTAIILDDMVDTAGTLTQAARALSERGAVAVQACCTHPVLSGPAIERIVDSPIDRLVITNTIPLNAAGAACSKIIDLSIAEILGETIKRVHDSNSVSTLFV
ncbi:MAG: phosphoribosylpyrophosphate synthetase [Desulfobacteraceae bacterium 4572_87]|nr:MAG: phosphoribosylpyrophosphate synthetase [Desulfobacteraceae bacterium 4572_87]